MWVRHFKGNEYEIISISTANYQDAIVHYKNAEGTIHSPLLIDFEANERNNIHNVKDNKMNQTYRFEQIIE